jgi:hypothetical protein
MASAAENVAGKVSAHNPRGFGVEFRQYTTLFSQPEGGKNKKSTRLASLLSTWRGDLDHIYR